MNIINCDMDSEKFESFMNQSIELEEMKKAFEEANTDFFVNRIPLWREIQTPFSKNGISATSIRSTNGVLVESKQITSAMLGEALEYFCRSFYNFYAQDKLIEHSYSTWSEVTNYYASFFGLHSLLRLQGRAITSIWRRGKRFYIFPFEIKKHQYVITCKGVKSKSAHAATWNLFYEVYDTFSYTPNVNFEAIFKRKNVGTVEEEIDFRNQINYEPYQGYEEIRHPPVLESVLENYEEKRFTDNEIELLSGLSTDPDYRYYARSVLRIVFINTLLKEIAENNGSLKKLLSERRKTLSEFLEHSKPREDENMICCRLGKLLNLGA